MGIPGDGAGQLWDGDERLKVQPTQDRIGTPYVRAGCSELWSRLLISSHSRNLGVCGLSRDLGLEAALHASIIGGKTGFESAQVAVQAYWSVAVRR